MGGERSEVQFQLMLFGALKMVLMEQVKTCCKYVTEREYLIKIRLNIILS